MTCRALLAASLAATLLLVSPTTGAALADAAPGPEGQSGRRAVPRDGGKTRGREDAGRKRQQNAGRERQDAGREHQAEQPRRAAPERRAVERDASPSPRRAPSDDRAGAPEPRIRQAPRDGGDERTVEREEPRPQRAPPAGRAVLTPQGATRDARARQAPDDRYDRDDRDGRLDRQQSGRANRGTGSDWRSGYVSSPPPRRGGRTVTSIGIGSGGIYFYNGPGRLNPYRGYRYPVYNRVRFGGGFRYQSGFDYGHPYGYGYAFRAGYGYGYWPYYPIYSYGAYVTTYDRYPALGAVRLDIEPTYAHVFVDGYFVGEIDDFDGVFQRLRLEAGPHQIEVHADGYEPLYLDVYVRPGETIRYEGYLQYQRRP